MMEFKITVLEQKIEELERLALMQASTVSQMLGTIQVALEEDDIDEALELVKSYQNN